MSHQAFISYVREDASRVERLATSLRAKGFNVWLDREQILPGARWQDAVRKAIQHGKFFIACFSSHYAARERSYMNEELVIAIEELRNRPTDRVWFMPVLFDSGSLPDRTIGAGETLADIQFADLSSNWQDGTEELLAAMDQVRISSAKSSLERALAELQARTIDRQEDWLTWASQYGTPRDLEVADALRGIMIAQAGVRVRSTSQNR